MSSCLPVAWVTLVPAQSNRLSVAHAGISAGVFRLPTDPLYYADLVLQNVLANSRYRVTRDDTGAQLATGITAGSPSADDITLSDVPAYANPMLVRIVVRNASGGTKYKPFETLAYLYRTGGAAYILQQVD